MLSAVIFVACNSVFFYYLWHVSGLITKPDEALVSMLSTGIVLLGVFQVAQFVTGFGSAPTGKFNEGMLSTGVTLPNQLAWCTMEQPSFLIPCVLLVSAVLSHTLLHPSRPGFFLLCLFCTHYFQRAYVYPCLTRSGRGYPVHAWAFAMLFTACNGTMMASDLLFPAYGVPNTQRSIAELTSPRALAGIGLFFLGMVRRPALPLSPLGSACLRVFGGAKGLRARLVSQGLNVHSDYILRNLRRPGESAYKIPRGGLFELVSGANFVAEIIEWSGFALACYPARAPLAFAAFNWMGIGTRAISTHAWNLQRFGEKYPRGRKRLIPFVW